MLGGNVGRSLATRSAGTLFLVHSLAAFGLLSAFIQFYAVLWNRAAITQPWWILASVVLLASAYGIGRSVSPRRITRKFRNPDTSIRVVVGDIFEQSTHIVVGFTDTFDTDIRDDRIIHSKSVQGQLLSRVYHGDRIRLDLDLWHALKDCVVKSTESRTTKPLGKRQRYEVGTTVLLRSNAHKIFGTAYGNMQNDLVVRTSSVSLWYSLSNLWETIRLHGNLEPVSIPLIGSELARLSSLNRENIARLVLLSYIAHSRERPVARELRIVVHPKDLAQIRMRELDAFISML